MILTENLVVLAFKKVLARLITDFERRKEWQAVNGDDDNNKYNTLFEGKPISTFFI